MDDGKLEEATELAIFRELLELWNSTIFADAIYEPNKQCEMSRDNKSAS